MACTCKTVCHCSSENNDNESNKSSEQKSSERTFSDYVAIGLTTAIAGPLGFALGLDITKPSDKK